jgi:hypothetical protein
MLLVTAPLSIAQAAPSEETVMSPLSPSAKAPLPGEPIFTQFAPSQYCITLCVVLKNWSPAAPVGALHAAEACPASKTKAEK